MDLSQVAISELAGEKVSFKTQEHLERHVRDHVIEKRDEKWWAVLDPDSVGKARQECKDDQLGPEFQSLAGRYQDLLGQCLQDACTARQHHSHNAEIWWNADWVQEVRAQLIYAWPVELRLFVTARAVARGVKFGRYVLKTGYRRPELSERAFLELAYEKFLERSILRNRPVIALHDKKEEQT